MATELQFTVLFEENEGGGYTVTIPSVPGCISFGKTIEEAKKNIQKALKLHLACVRAHSGKKIHPHPKNIFAAMFSG